VDRARAWKTRAIRSAQLRRQRGRVSHTLWTAHAPPTRPTGTFVGTLEHQITSRISKIRGDTNARELTEQRRYAPTSIPLRRNPGSRSPESLFHFTEIPTWRGGSVDSQVTLGGRQVELPRLRVRSAEGEVPLASFQWAAATDPLDEHTLAAVAAGVSTRRYASTLDPVPSEVTERATSSSAVSRRFVALSSKRLQAFLDRPLGELDLRVVCIDGKVFRDHCMVIALGIDTQGRKHVLGLREGATETAAVTTGLLSDLVTRGLPTDRTVLFVIDGAAGLRRAITDVFGSRGVVQRCQVHKCRNVLGHLPERLHASVGKALRDAWDLDSADRAARVLKRLAGSLERDHPGAAASIREGLDETLTVQRLGLTGALQRTLRTTNIIENLNGSVEHYSRNVKRWRGGQMIQRWVASALVEAEKRFRRVRGYRDLQHLVRALDAMRPPDGMVADVA